MGRTRPTDFVNWTLYRRAWLLVALAAAVVLATSFRPEQTVESSLPPTFTNANAKAMISRAAEFDDLFPDRRPGSPGSIDSAQWIRGEFEHAGLKATTVPATTVSPTTSASVGLVNVEAMLPGRTAETVVVLAHRDNRGARRAAGNSVGTVALLELSEQLANTHDRRRSYLFVSTDGATLNGAGARALASRLAKRPAQIISVIALDQLGAAKGTLHVPIEPSGRYAAPLGLAQAARDAVAAEEGDPSTPSSITQIFRLAAPVTLLEHGQLLQRGLPAISLSGAPGQSVTDDAAAVRPSVTAAGNAMRALQRLTGTIDAVDQLQSAGKTYVASSARVYRGWALKVLIATMLLPVWMAVVDLLVRHRRHWNMFSSLGSAARAMLGGLWAVAALWIVGLIGLMPRSTDHPPNPVATSDISWFGLIVWGALVAGGWLLARGPDWRRTLRPSLTAAPGARDGGDLVMGQFLLIVLSVLGLAINPYAVILVVPVLHIWLWLDSLRAYGRVQLSAIWAIGAAIPVLAILLIAGRFGTGLHTPWYILQLVQTRTVPASMSILIACGFGLGALQLIAARGSVAWPALPRLRDRSIDPAATLAPVATHGGNARQYQAATAQAALDTLTAARRHAKP